MAKDKVYSGYLDGKRFLIVRASGRKQALELLKASGCPIGYSTIRNYFSETGNKHALAAATHPGVWELIEPDKHT